jgi:hypothetical protein
MTHFLEEDNLADANSSNGSNNTNAAVNESNNVENGSIDNMVDFFNQLDRSVTNDVQGALQEDNQATQNNGPEIEQSTNKNDLGDGHDYKKRYGDSTRQNQVLMDRLQQYERYLPFIDAMNTDKQFAEMVKNYSESDKSKAVSYDDILNNLGLGEEFEFDAEEAVANEKSASGKVFRALIDIVASKRANESENAVLKTVKDYLDIERFKTENNISNDQFNEIASYAENLKLTWDKVLKLMELENGTKTKTNKANVNVQNKISGDESRRQRKIAADIPNSLSGTNSSNSSITSDQKLFNAILNLDKANDFSKVFESAK